MRVRRIVIKGASGSGKSTLGLELSQLLGVPWVELDRLHHGPQWTAATAVELQQRVRDVIEGASGWVVDGNYDSKLEGLVVDNADLVLWLDLPLPTLLLRVARRTARNWLTGAELWNGNRESFKSAFWGRDALFAWTVRSYRSNRREWPQKLGGRPLVRLRTPREVADWLSAFRAQSDAASGS